MWRIKVNRANTSKWLNLFDLEFDTYEEAKSYMYSHMRKGYTYRIEKEGR